MEENEKSIKVSKHDLFKKYYRIEYHHRISYNIIEYQKKKISCRIEWNIGKEENNLFFKRLYCFLIQIF